MSAIRQNQSVTAPTRAPVLIGAVGGSGTRVVTRILAGAGYFIGAHRNYAEDSEPLMDFFKTWLRLYIALSGRAFGRAIADHRHGIELADHPWVVKVPRSLLMLQYWRQKFPDLQFIHVVRSGLDMAYSTDNNQLQMFQDILLPAKGQELPRPLRAMHVGAPLTCGLPLLENHPLDLAITSCVSRTSVVNPRHHLEADAMTVSLPATPAT